MRDFSLCTYDPTSDRNEQPTILHQIEHIKFPALKWISISNNRLVSVENLPRIWMPHLEGFYISTPLST